MCNHFIFDVLELKCMTAVTAAVFFSIHTHNKHYRNLETSSINFPLLRSLINRHYDIVKRVLNEKYR